VYICTASLSIHLSMNNLGCLYVLAIVNSAAVNIGVHVSFQTMVFSRCMPRSGIAGSYGSSIFSCMRLNVCVYVCLSVCVCVYVSVCECICVCVCLCVCIVCM